MKKFITRFSDLIKGRVSGFDRIVFKGLILPLMSSSYCAVYSKKNGYLQLRNYQTRCKHLYFYFDDKDLGFMNIYTIANVVSISHSSLS